MNSFSCIRILAISILCYLASAYAFAQGVNKAKEKNIELTQPTKTPSFSRWALNPFTGGFSNLGEAFTGTNLIYHALAFGITPVIIATGLDENGRAHFEGQKNGIFGHRATRVYLHAGDYYQVAIGLMLYGGGHLFKSQKHLGGGSALLQAVTLTGFYVSSLKLLTGRPRPGPGLDTDFSPFNLKRNISEKRARWPSGHTASAFAFAASLTAYYADAWYLKYLVYPFATTMAVAMVEGDFHWTSDVVAGALLGHVIGWVVGKNFRRSYKNPGQLSNLDQRRERFQLALVPRVGYNQYGLMALLSY